MNHCFARKRLLKNLLCTFAFPKCHHGKSPRYRQSCADTISDIRTQTKLSCCNQAISSFEPKLSVKTQTFPTGSIQNGEHGDSNPRNLIPCGWRARVRLGLPSSPGSRRRRGSTPGSRSGIRAPISRENNTPSHLPKLIENKHEKRSLTKYF